MIDHSGLRWTSLDEPVRAETRRSVAHAWRAKPGEWRGAVGPGSQAGQSRQGGAGSARGPGPEGERLLLAGCPRLGGGAPGVHRRCVATAPRERPGSLRDPVRWPQLQWRRPRVGVGMGGSPPGGHSLPEMVTDAWSLKRAWNGHIVPF